MAEEKNVVETMSHSQCNSIWVALIMTTLFGPLGLLYFSFWGGIVLIVVTLAVALFTGGLGIFVAWPISMIWGVVAVIVSKERLRNPLAIQTKQPPAETGGFNLAD